MIFNINESYSLQNTGIESAQFNRFKVFRKYHIKFAAVTVKYSPDMNWILTNQGIYNFKLKSKEYINLYDYFQQAMDIPDIENLMKNYHFNIQGTNATSRELVTKYNKELNRIEVYNLDQRLLCRMDYYTELNDENYQQNGNFRVHGVEDFDEFGNLTRYRIYDKRGFLSLEQIYNPDNVLSKEIFYTPTLKPAIIKSYRNKNGDQTDNKAEIELDNIIVHNYYNNKLEVFDNELELEDYFFNEISDQYYNNIDNNIYVIDRSNICQEAMLKVAESPNNYVIFHYHNSHGGEVQDEMYSVPNDNYEFSLENINRFNAIIVATEEQKHDLKSRYQIDIPIFVIPVGVVPDRILNRKHVPMNKRQSHSLIMTARIASEKQMEDVVQAINEVKKKYKDVHLNIYGFKNMAQLLEPHRIEYLVKKYHLEDNVTIHDYVHDTGAVQRQNQIYVVSSYMEGFNIALMEGLAEGCVGVCYDVKYGPASLVKNNQNGYLVKMNDWQALGQKIIYLFDHPDVLQKMSDKAYELSNRYSTESIYKKWLNVISASYLKNKDDDLELLNEGN